MGRDQFDECCRVLGYADTPSTFTSLYRAWAFFVVARQSRAGGFKGFTSITRSRTRRGVNGNVSEWLGAIDGLEAIHQRLQPVILENMPALDLIAREDTPDTLHYLDPPYLHETRESKELYKNEMTELDHQTLLTRIIYLKGKVMISGYRSDLYDYYLKEWKRHELDIANHNAGGDEKRRMVECLWCNF
jgi:Site-specific DNA methylase